jgi:multicomponent Na+:H+ antiporter subunit D
MPVTAMVFWVAAFSISGMPLFNGFISKGMIMMAAEHANIWLWVLLEIASFGTFLSFLKLGYFAFLRPGKSDVSASDPPILMQAGMIGAAILCVAIGVYPPLLYAILPVPVEYQAYTLASVGGALLVFGAAVVFFFTAGRRLLEPHDPRLMDADVAYIAAGNGIVRFAGGLQGTFQTIYGIATDTAASIFAVSKWAMRMEDRDVNWNIIAFGGTLVILSLLVFLVVGII